MGKATIPNATRIAVAERYVCPPGGSTTVTCERCDTIGFIYWWPRRDGRPSGWVSFTLELDHIQPEALGGTHGPENIQLLCRRCNRQKGARG